MDSPSRAYRPNISRAILLGLEFLVIVDIIRTAVMVPTIDNVLPLGLIEIIHTFLNFSFELELDDRWPWQCRENGEGKPASRPDPAEYFLPGMRSGPRPRFGIHEPSLRGGRSPGLPHRLRDLHRGL